VQARLICAVLNRSKLCVLSSRSKSGDPARRPSPAPEGMAPMHTESSEPGAASDPRLERAIVLALLNDEDDTGRRCSRHELSQELGAEEQQLQGALDGLLRAGVVCAGEDLLWASAAARRLDELELIGI
jgi:hypothetical protein